MIKTATSEELLEYRKHPALNQSYLKSLLPGQSKREYSSDEQSNEMLLGSLVDCLLLTPELFADLYYTGAIVSNPNDKTGKLVEWVYKFNPMLATLDCPTGHELLQLAREQLAYQPNWKTDTFINYMFGKGQAEEHYGFLQEADGKKVVGANMVIQARLIAMDLKHQVDRMLKRSHKQVVLFRDHEDWTPLKGVLDIVSDVDPFIGFTDLKVTHSTLDKFKYSCRKYRYDFQMAFYQDLLACNAPNRQLRLPELLVYSTSEQRAHTFIVTEEMMHVGRYGGHRMGSIMRVKEPGSDDLRFSSEETDYIHGYLDALSIERRGGQYASTPELHLNCWS